MPDLEGRNGQRTDFAIVGKANVPGKLSYNIATGKAKFGADATAPNMLFAKFLRSPYAHAIVKSVDTSKAKALSGVVDILTWEDPDLKGWMNDGPLGSQGGLMLDNIADQEDAEVAVIVVAETEDLCDEALRALQIDWEVRTPIADPHDGMKPDAPVMPGRGGPQRGGMGMGPGGPPPGPPKHANVTFASNISGNVEEGFKEADQFIEFDFVLPAMTSHIPNPSVSMAYWYNDQGASEGQNLWIEGISQGREQIARQNKIPYDKVTEATLYQGGKYCDWGYRKAQLITPLLAKRTGRPVKCLSYRENMYDFGINQHWVHAKVGFKNDGLITGAQLYTVADNGCRGSLMFGSTSDLGYGPWFTTKCKNVHQTMDAVSTNRGKMYLSSQFCPFQWDTVTVANQLIAEKLGMDVIDVAKKNLHGPTSQDDTSPVPSFEACVEAGKKLMKWQYHKTGAKKLPDGRMHGMAFRYQMNPRHQISSYTVTVYLRGGKVYLPTKGPCTGMFATDALAMVLAEETGAKWEDVVVEYDNRSLFTPVGGGSDGTTSSGWVVKEAAVELKQKILEAALSSGGGMMGFGPPTFPKGTKVEDLDTKDSTIFLKSDPSKKMPFSSIAAPMSLNIQDSIAVTVNGRAPQSIWSAGMGRRLDVMNTTYCEVAVDTETGHVEVLRHGVVCDPGKVLRRTSLEGQIQQAMMFSEACGLNEEFVWDKKTGVRLTSNMFEYKRPTIMDITFPDIDLQETRGSNAVYGASGISHSMSSTHMIVCAIQNAIGKWVDPPATPDKVLKALGKA
jgi:CO/xanthine dehydrogenase Mo-binding subunit